MTTMVKIYVLAAMLSLLAGAAAMTWYAPSKACYIDPNGDAMGYSLCKK
jgi:hypothetical protein